MPIKRKHPAVLTKSTGNTECRRSGTIFESPVLFLLQWTTKQQGALLSLGIILIVGAGDGGDW